MSHVPWSQDKTSRLSPREQERVQLAKSRIPGGYLHPHKAFTFGFVLFIWSYIGLPIVATLFSMDVAFFYSSIPSFLLSWVLFYNGIQYDHLLFQQLPTSYRVGRMELYLCLFLGPVWAAVYLLGRPRGY